MSGGAWPFLVGGAICLVNSVNERDLSLLTSYVEASLHGRLLRGTMASGEASSAMDRAQVPWKGAAERVRAPSCPDPVAPRGAVYESGCLRMQPQSGGKFRPRLNMGERPLANKYRQVKMKRTLKRDSKSA
ncbi:hypothetical protein YC2023_072306 [Brassica napus]